MIRLAKLVALSLAFIVLICPKSYGQEPLTLKNTLTLATGEVIELPTPPGFFRVDGVSAEVDKYYSNEIVKIENRALFISDIRNFPENLLAHFDHQDKDWFSLRLPPFDMIWACADDRFEEARKSLNATVEELLERVKQNYITPPKTNYVYGDVPNTIFISRMPNLTNPYPPGLYAVTYWNGVFIEFNYNLGASHRSLSIEELKTHEELLLNWVIETRKGLTTLP